MYGMHQKEDLGKGQEGQVYCDFSYIMYVHYVYIFHTLSEPDLTTKSYEFDEWLKSGYIANKGLSRFRACPLPTQFNNGWDEGYVTALFHIVNLTNNVANPT